MNGISHEGYVPDSYLNTTARLFQKVKQHSYDLMSLSSGDRCLDIGCGPGIDVQNLYRIVGSAGIACGIDFDLAMLCAAQQKNVANHAYMQANALTLPFANESFSAVRCERLLQHIATPDRAAAEMCRVTRRGGRIVIADTDHGSLLLNCSDHTTEQAIVQANARRIHNGYSGRKIYELLVNSGLTDISIQPYVLDVTDLQTFYYSTEFKRACEYAIANNQVGRHKANALLSELEQKMNSGVFYGAIMIILGAGTKT